MEYQTLIVDLKDNIGCIRLNRPDVMNALNTQMRAEIADAVTRIAPQVRVVVLTGTGRAILLWSRSGRSFKCSAGGYGAHPAR